uniref:Uncharacterized protein n=1 Tax=Arundo donax TaxID=35708 RepID=A0A0A8XW54_ARUDO
MSSSPRCPAAASPSPRHQSSALPRPASELVAAAAPRRALPQRALRRATRYCELQAAAPRRCRELHAARPAAVSPSPCRCELRATTPHVRAPRRHCEPGMWRRRFRLGAAGGSWKAHILTPPFCGAWAWIWLVA